jgi:signal transduction histidine kinase
MPPAPEPPPTRYSAGLVIFVSSLVVSAGLLAWRSVGPGPWLPIATLAAAAAVSDYFSVVSVSVVQTGWSTTTLMLLVSVVTLGPTALLATSLGVGMGFALRYRNGWFKTAFNVALHFISVMGGYAVFRWLEPHLLAGGLLLGAVVLLAESILLFGVIGIATHQSPVSPWMRYLRSVGGYYFVYGVAAAGAAAIYPRQGFATFPETLGASLALQAFLVGLARRVHWFNEETKQHQEARVRLLQQAIDASNTERERIAAGIHDGVVQDLVGLTFSLGAYANSDLSKLSTPELAELSALLGAGAETSRVATRDLRTLIIEIAAPKLKQEGLRAALDDLLHNISGNVETTLDMPDEIDSLAESQQALLYRVAQEALRNSMKYSEATHLKVGISKEEQSIVLLVADNGKGFTVIDRAKRQEEGHVGLTLLERTVKDGGGAFEIWSQPGEGTRITMRVPARALDKAGD